MYPLAPLLSSLLLLFSKTASADNSTSSIFPDTFAENDSPECHACLTELVEDTCGGASDPGLNECLCSGDGASTFRDDCFTTCCSGSVYCRGQPYTEWWTQCVDDYPQWCHDPPKSSIGGIDRTLQSEHCSDEEIEAAQSLASATSTAPYCTATAEFDLSEFNRDCTPVGFEDNDDEGVAVGVRMSPVLGIMAGFVVVWLN